MIINFYLLTLSFYNLLIVIRNWNLRQTGGTLATEILDVVLPTSIKEMSF